MDATRRPRVDLLLVVLAALLVYANTWRNELVFDDLKLLPELEAFHDPLDARALLARPHWGDRSLFRPLTVWTIALNVRAAELCGLPGLWLPGLHAVNLLLHAGASALVLLLARRLALGRAAALAAGLLFAVHPLHVEAVAAITGRAELLAAAAGLGFLLAHRAGRTPLAALALAAAVLAKESGVAWLGVAAAAEALLPAGGRRRWRPFVAYAAALAAWLVWRAAVVGPQPVPFVDNPLVAASLPARVLTALSVQLEYLRLLVLPYPLSSDYSYAEIETVERPSDPRVIAFVLVFAAVAALAVRLRRREPVVGLAVLSYALAFAPTCNVLLVVGTILGERLAYTPSVFFLLLAGVAFAALRARAPRAADALLAALVLAFGTLTVLRNRTWRDEDAFLHEQVRTAPRSAKAWYGLGTLRAKQGDERAAVELYDRALAILPSFAEAHFNRGNALRRLGAPRPEVLDAYRAAVRHDPAHAAALFNLARLLIESGDLDEARTVVARMAALDPPHPASAQFRAAIEAGGVRR